MARLPESLVQLRRQLQPLRLEGVRETGKELGRGSFGVVYEVIVSELVCAGKKQYDFLVQDRDSVFIDKFGQECFLHSQQRHPNIVQLMGIYYPPSARLPMLVMEYLPMSLTQCLDKHENLPLQIKYSILLDVAKGLNYLHCKQPPILHRDLTANNVLLTSNFVAKISDLGVSRMIDVTLRRRQALTKAPGNAIVMPPEAQKDNPVYDHRLDVFSYGCLVLHVFAQQWPFPSEEYVPSSQGKYEKVSEWNRRSKFTAMIPNGSSLLNFTESCLEDKPEKRPSINDAIRCAQHGLSTLPLLRNTLEYINLLDQMESEKVSLEDEKNTALQTIAAIEEEKQQALEAAARAENERKLAMDVAVRLEKEKCEAIESAEKTEKEAIEAVSKAEKEMKEALVTASKADRERKQAVEMARKREEEKWEAIENAEKAEKREREAIEAASKAEKGMKEVLATAAKADEERKQAVETARKMEEEKTKATNEALEAERVKQRAVAAASKERREKQQALARAAEERKQAVDLAMEEKAKAVEAAETREREALEEMKKTQALLDEKETAFGELKEQNHQLEKIKKKQMERLSRTWQTIAQMNVQLMAKEEEVQEKFKLLEQEMARANKLGEENVMLAETVSQLKEENVQLREREINQLKNEIKELKSEIKMVTMKSEGQLEEIIREKNALNIEKDGLKSEISRLVATLASLQEAHCSLEKVLKIKERQLDSFEHEIPSIKIQRYIVRHHMKQPLQRGDTWYLIGLYWFTQWKMYTGYDAYNYSVADNEEFLPGAVDNTALVKAVNDNSYYPLKGYAICAKPVWDHLVSWYGLSVGSEPIARNVIESNGVLEVEVNLVKLELSLYPHDNKIQTLFSCKETFDTVIQKAREIFNVSTTDKCRLWTSDGQLLDDLGETIVKSYCSCVLEVRNADGSWPMTIEVKLYVYPYTADGASIPLILYLTDDTVGTAIEKAKKVLDIPETVECRLWERADDIYQYSYKLLYNLNLMIYDTNKVAQYKCVILERRQSDGSWPMKIELSLNVYQKIVTNIKIVTFSSIDVVGTVVQKTKKLFGISATSECRLWKGSTLLTDLNETLATVGYHITNLNKITIVMLEVRDPDGRWPYKRMWKKLQLCIYPHTDDTAKCSFHTQDDTINTVLQKVKELFSVPADKECRLLYNNSGSCYQRIDNFEIKVSSLIHSKYILEVKDDDTGWPTKITLNLCIYSDMETVRQCSFDPIEDNIGTVVQKARDLFSVATTDECRLWDSTTLSELQDLKKPISAAKLRNEDKLVLEVRESDGSWPLIIKVNLCLYHTNDIKVWSFHGQGYDDTATVITTAKVLFDIPAHVECKLFTSMEEISWSNHLSSDEDLIVVPQSSDGSWPVKLFELSVYPDTDKSQDCPFDVTYDSLNDVVEGIRELFNVSTDSQYRLWMGKYPSEKLMDSSKMLCDYPEAKRIVLEVKSPDGSWPRTIKLKLCTPPHLDRASWKKYSFDPMNMISTVMQKTKELFAVDTAAECRLWWENPNGPFILLDDLEKTICGVGIYESERPMLLEVKDPVTDSWPFTLQLRLSIWPDIDYCKVCSFHMLRNTIDTVVQKMREVFHVSKDSEVRVWRKLESTYSVAKDVNFKHSKLNDQLILEVKNPDGSWPWRIELSLCVYPNTSTVKRKSFHVHDDTLGTVIQSMRELFNIRSTDQCRLWRMESCGTLEFLCSPLKDMSDKEEILFNNAKVTSQATLVLEKRHLANSWSLKITLKLCGPPYGLSQPIEYDFEGEETLVTVMNTMKSLFNRSEDEECILMQQEDDGKLTQVYIYDRMYTTDTTKKLLLIGNSTVRATCDYKAGGDDEIIFNEGDIIYDVEEIEEGKCRGTCNGKRGLLPSNYVKKI